MSDLIRELGQELDGIKKKVHHRLGLVTSAYPFSVSIGDAVPFTDVSYLGDPPAVGDAVVVAVSGNDLLILGPVRTPQEHWIGAKEITQTYPDGENNPVEFEELVSAHGIENPTGVTCVLRKPGLYKVTAWVGWGTNTDGIRSLDIYHNAENAWRNRQKAYTNVRMQVSGDIVVEEGLDTVSIIASQDSGSTRNLEKGRLSVVYMGSAV